MPDEWVLGSNPYRALKGSKLLDDSVDHRQVKYSTTDSKLITARSNAASDHARLQVSRSNLRHAQGHWSHAHDP
jgi:hypothetical protein